MCHLRTAVLVFVCFIAHEFSAQPATFTVNTVQDAVDASPGDGVCLTSSGQCSLRAAVMEANAIAGADIVVVPAGSYALTIPHLDPFEKDSSVGDLDVTDHLILRGEGAGATVIDASVLGDRVISVNGARFDPDPLQIDIIAMTLTGGTTLYTGGCIQTEGNGTFTIRDSVITGCSAPRSTGGGIVHLGYGQVGTVVLIDSVVRENAASYGGGISNINGNLELVRSVVTRNTALGPYGGSQAGGIYLPVAPLTAIDSEISDNQAGRRGGGIVASQTTVTLMRTTVSGNETLNESGTVGFGEGSGGGLYIERVRLIVLNSTISSNIAANEGAGIYSEREGTFLVSFSTIADNMNLSDMGGAGLNMRDPVGRPDPLFQNFNASLLTGNRSTFGETNCLLDIPPTSLGFNFDTDGSCGLTGPTDRPDDPMLAPLAANGGVGATHALDPASPAIDVVPSNECVFLFDNDSDRRIDEDPVDGIDNDGDFRVDEDPVELVDVDERGKPRPYGAGCDAGAFERNPEGKVADLREGIEELLDSGALNNGQGNALLSKLDAAEAAVERGQTAVAINQLNAFINQMESFLRARILTESEARPLIDAAQALIEELRG